ncbi:Bug family tripartite tricarboxylate transporter substrate binding protein [Roseomonas marmotae]|uniref:Tripartite tricarboxylate transporter substrate binding protein n=1 Tax=Roseomonas marmotae TaxID=2768161 RepID=A0ABS3KIF7_9PROT|nr:tripartite tricarboxylate transporter substrate binding protein [Roseomonas marmotae]MBO1076101.1 tripartite tricarboxylate transporter substrate binding protein [Roseomonas marmotae]QTI81337.1 tripartite tricarboxylate transporter substrate binding protein [Roseomonas marmotae]
MFRYRLLHRLLGAAAMAMLAMGAARPAVAQDNWPDRPIRLIIPFAAGGISDSIARLAAEWLGRQLGQPVVADNRPGGNGIIGLEAVGRSAPDGYTLLAASASNFVVLPLMQRISLDPARDFTPVSITATNPLVLVVAPELGARNLTEFRDIVGLKPGALNYASGGAGGLSHLGMSYLLHVLGLKMEHVPYRSGPLAVQDLLGKRVPAYLGNYVDIAGLLDNEGLRVISVTAPERLGNLPDVPTVAEQGYPGFELGTWNGLAAPAALPEPIRDRLARAMAAACQDQEFRAAILRLGAEPACSTPAAMTDSIARMTPVMRQAIELSGTRVE